MRDTATTTISAPRTNWVSSVTRNWRSVTRNCADAGLRSAARSGPSRANRARLAHADAPQTQERDVEDDHPERLTADEGQGGRDVDPAAKDLRRHSEHVPKGQREGDRLEDPWQKRERSDLPGEDEYRAVPKSRHGVYPSRPEGRRREKPSSEEAERRCQQHARHEEQEMHRRRSESRVERHDDDAEDQEQRDHRRHLPDEVLDDRVVDRMKGP